MERDFADDQRGKTPKSGAGDSTPSVHRRVLLALLFLPAPLTAGSNLIQDFVSGNGICTIDPGTGGLVAGIDLLRSTIATSPQPVCNDGTLPLMYVRRGSGPGSGPSPNWVIHLQGGGACTDYSSCLARWCDPSPPVDAAKMSSDFALDMIQGKGIFSQNPSFSNPFRNWNHVLLYYCSSDQWVGAGSGTVLLEENPGSASAYEIYFQGLTILEAAIDLLIAGAQPDSAGFTLPSLADASRVIFSGDSAGSTGARSQADRIEARILAVHSDPPSLDFRLVGDAAMISAPERLGPPAWEATVKPAWDDVWVPVWQGVPDESCVTSKGGLGSPEVWKCADPNHVIAHHVSVPFFTRQDLADPVKEKQSIERFASHVADQLTSWGSYPAISPPYATNAIEPDSPSQGTFGPNCRAHVGIRNDEGFFGHTVEVSGVGPLAYVDVLTNWLAGSGPRFVVEDVERNTEGLAIRVDPSSGPDCSPLVLEIFSDGFESGNLGAF